MPSILARYEGVSISKKILHRLEEALKRNGCSDSHAEFTHLYVKHKRCIELLRYNSRAGSDVSDRIKYQKCLAAVSTIIDSRKGKLMQQHGMSGFGGNRRRRSGKNI